MGDDDDQRGLAQGLLARVLERLATFPRLAALTCPIWIPILLAFFRAIIRGGTRALSDQLIIVLTVPSPRGPCRAPHGGADRIPTTGGSTLDLSARRGLGWPLLLIALFWVARIIRSDLRRRFA